MRTLAFLAASIAVILAASDGTALQPPPGRASWVNVNVKKAVNPNPAPQAGEQVIVVYGDYDCGREAGQTLDNLPVRVEVKIQRADMVIIEGEEILRLSPIDKSETYPKTSSGKYEIDKRFYLKIKTNDNPPKDAKYYVTATLFYTQAGSGGPADRSAVTTYTPATAP